MCWTSFKTIGHSSINSGPSQKNLCPSWCPKLVTGLVVGIAGRLSYTVVFKNDDDISAYFQVLTVVVTVIVTYNILRQKGIRSNA